MTKREKIIRANKIIDRMKNLKEVQRITGENPIVCRLFEHEINEIIDFMTEYVYIRERITGGVSGEKREEKKTMSKKNIKKQFVIKAEFDPRGWIHIEERLPQKDQIVLAKHKAGTPVVCVCFSNDGQLEEVENGSGGRGYFYPEPEWGDGYDAWTPVIMNIYEAIEEDIES